MGEIDEVQEKSEREVGETYFLVRDDDRSSP